MCRAVRCRTCSKTTWSGCGAHIAQVKARVPADQWCAGHQADATSTNSETKPSWIQRLLGHTGGNS